MNAGSSLFAAAIALLLGLNSAIADSATWLTNPGSGEWNDAGNWTVGGPPNTPKDTATFGFSTVSNLSVSSSTQVSGIIFNPGTTYTINVSTLGIHGSGITNVSGATQNFVARAGGEIYFTNNASAGLNTVFTIGGDPGDGGIAEFFDSSTAGHATITINGSNHDLGQGGFVTFSDSSTSVGSATLIVNGSPFQHCPPGKSAVDIDPCFDNPYPQGVLNIFSTAGNGTLIANGGTNGGDGGVIAFSSRSTGGTARVKVFGNGNLAVFNHDDALYPLTIGSLEGDGLVFLGGNNLTIGSNNLSTTFTGAVKDGLPIGERGEGNGGSITKIGMGTLVLSGVNTYTGPTTIDGGALKVDGSIISAVTVNSGGRLSGSGSCHSVTVNMGGTIAPLGAKPLHINSNYVQHAHGILEIEVADANPTSSGHLDIDGDSTIDGTLEVRFVNGFLPVTGQVFKLFHVEGALNGTFAEVIFPDLRAGFQFQAEFVNGYYQVTALNDGVPATGFLNISTRMQVGTGDNALIGGFIVTGTVPKRVILRAIGPSLAQSGVANALADPTLEVRDSVGGLVSSNDNWMESAQVQEIIDSGIPPSDEHEAAIVATLPPGNYTAVMRGMNNSTGVGVVEVYDLAQDVPAKLANISTRGFVETGDNVMIGGFIAGNQAMHVMVRALGPSLTQSGVPNALADPTLELHDGQGAVIAFNDDWQDTNAALIEATGIPPTNDKEAAILATLAPGNYTGIVRGVNETTGVGLVEFYDLH